MFFLGDNFDYEEPKNQTVTKESSQETTKEISSSPIFIRKRSSSAQNSKSGPESDSAHSVRIQNALESRPDSPDASNDDSESNLEGGKSKKSDNRKVSDSEIVLQTDSESQNDLVLKLDEEGNIIIYDTPKTGL